MLKEVERTPAGEESGELLPLDEIARVGARRMLMAALATEAADYVERHRDERNSEGRALAVHNGRAKARKLKRRGMVAPVVAVGDGALGFWAAAREVWPRDPRAGLLVPQARQRAR